MKHKVLALLLCLAIILTMTLPGTLTVSSDTDALTTQLLIPGAAEKAAATETPEPPTETPVETPAETPSEEPSQEPSEEPSEEPAQEPSVEPSEEPTTGENNTEDTTTTTEPEPTCTCGATDGNHTEGCALYTEPEKELSLYEKLMATKSAAEFDAIIAECTEDQLVFCCEEFDQLNDHYIYLTTGAYPSHEPIVEEVSTTVNFTNVAPLVGSGK